MEYNTIDVSGIAESLRTLKTITPIKRNKYLDDLAVQVAPLDNNDLETLFKNLPLGPMTASKLRIKIQRVKDSIASGKPIESDKLSLVKKLEEAQLIVQADKRKSAKAQAEAARLAKEAAAAKAAEAAAEVRAAEEARIAAEKLAQEAEAKAAEEARIAAEKLAQEAEVRAAEEARIAAEKLAQEAEAKAAEEARIAAEKLAQEAEAKAAEEARIAAEKLAQEAEAKAAEEARIAAEKLAQEAEAKAAEEARIAAEKLAQEAEAKAAEEARIAAEKLAQEAEAKAAEEARIAAEKLAQEAEAKAAEEAETAGEATQLKALIVKAQDLKKSLDYVPPSLDKQFKEATDPSKSVEQSLVSIAKFISSATKSLRKESVQAVDALRVSSDYNDSYLEEIMDGYCDKDTKYKFFIAVLDESCAEDSDHYICEPENNIIGTFNALYQDCDTQ